jgi:hypothetical protein
MPISTFTPFPDESPGPLGGAQDPFRDENSGRETTIGNRKAFFKCSNRS